MAFGLVLPYVYYGLKLYKAENILGGNLVCFDLTNEAIKLMLYESKLVILTVITERMVNST